MPKALAIHTVHVGREPGKVSELTGKVTQAALVDEYKPTDIITELPQKQFDELKALGAVREPTAVDEAAAAARGYVDPAVVRAANAADAASSSSPSLAAKTAGDSKTAGDGKAAGDNLLG